MNIRIEDREGTYVAKGDRLYLRELKHSDVTERYLSWFADDTVIRFLFSKYLSYEDVTQYMDYGRETKTYFMYAICTRDKDLHIGNVKVGPIDWTAMRSDLVTVIGDTVYWGQGLATEAILLGNRLGFDAYQMRELAGHIAVENIGSLKSYARAGWVETNRISKLDSRELICVSCFNPKYYSAQDSNGKLQGVKPISYPTSSSQS